MRAGAGYGLKSLFLGVFAVFKMCLHNLVVGAICVCIHNKNMCIDIVYIRA